MVVTTDSKQHPDGRARRRFASMQRVQEAALDLFEARGFAGVTIEEIAAAADVGPATVYRNFGSKERIVLWDDYDSALFAQIGTHLEERSAIEGVVAGLIAALDPVYARDRVRILRRARLIFGTVELRAQASFDMAELRRSLGDLLVSHGAASKGLEAEVLAAAITGTLEAGIAQWVRASGRPALAVVLERAFQHLASNTHPRTPVRSAKRRRRT